MRERERESGGGPCFATFFFLSVFVQLFFAFRISFVFGFFPDENSPYTPTTIHLSYFFSSQTGHFGGEEETAAFLMTSTTTKNHFDASIFDFFSFASLTLLSEEEKKGGYIH
jgi:hypothetical protein